MFMVLILKTIFENQVIPVNVHNLSKRFRPNLAMTRVLLLGTKFIPKWNCHSKKKTVVEFNNFKRKSSKEFRVKSYFVPVVADKDVCIDDTDTNLGAATADKSDVSGECRGNCTII